MKTFKQYALTEAFTKQHYIAVAKAIQEVAKEMDDAAAESALSRLAMRLADIFKDDNPRFDKGYFLTACGI